MANSWPSLPKRERGDAWFCDNADLYYSAAIISFLLIFGFANIKSFFRSEIYWTIGLLPLLATMPCVAGVTSLPGVARQCLADRRIQWYLMFWAIFCAGIVVSAAFNNWRGLYTIAKYIVIAILSTYLICYPPKFGTLEFGLKLWCGLSLVIVLSLIIFNIGRPLMINWHWVRVGWILAPPGVLWKAGIFLFPWLIWRLLQDSRWEDWLWLLLAVMVVRFDGSRTGMVVIVLLFILLTIAALLRQGIPKARTSYRAFNIALVLCFSFSTFLLVRGRHNEFLLVFFALAICAAIGWGISRYGRSLHLRWSTAIVLFLLISSGTVFVLNSTGLVDFNTLYCATGFRPLQKDDIRYQMLSAGVKGAVQNFPVGGGFASTVAHSRRSGPDGMVVHMTYLQVLSDLGILGLIGYLGVFALPLWVSVRDIVGDRKRWERFDERILPLGILFIYLFSGLFHPVSNELSEWGIVVLAIGVLFNKPVKVMDGTGHR